MVNPFRDHYKGNPSEARDGFTIRSRDQPAPYRDASEVGVMLGLKSMGRYL